MNRVHSFSSPQKELSIWKGLHRIYDILKSPITFVIYILLIVTCVILDFVPAPYVYPILEWIFESKNPGAILDTSLVIWSFSTALIIFYLEKMKEHFYGVGLYEVLLKSDSTAMLAFKMVFFAFSLALLALSAAYDLSITLTFLGVLQLVLMGYVFLMVCIETSGKEVRKKIFDEIIESIRLIFDSNGYLVDTDSDIRKTFSKIHSKYAEKAKKYLYLKMLNNISFSNAQDKNVFIDFIEQAKQEKCWEVFCKEKPSVSDKKGDDIKCCVCIYFSYALASAIIHRCHDQHTRNEIFLYIYGLVLDCQKYSKYMIFGFTTCLIMNFDIAKTDFNIIIGCKALQQTEKQQEKIDIDICAKQCAREIGESQYYGGSPGMAAFMEDWCINNVQWGGNLPANIMSSQDKKLVTNFILFLQEKDIII